MSRTAGGNARTITIGVSTVPPAPMPASTYRQFVLAPTQTTNRYSDSGEARSGGDSLDWRANVELFEEIRREYEFSVGTITGVSKKLGVHRRMVREAIGSALPKPRKRTERPRWKMQAAVEFVDAVLEADRKAARKQRHTAHRIWERIQHELPDCKIGERTVRQYVHSRKIALGLMVRETCVPQSYDWGAEAQVDWYEAYADLAGERIKLQVFAMRSMASGAAFHCAYLHATQQAFLEAHELAFAYFWGRLPEASVRQPDLGGKEGPAWIPPGGNGALRCLPFALAV